AILAAISFVAYNGVQARARDSERVNRVNSIAKAIELYKIDNGQYPPIQDGGGFESSCGSQTENWGHCDRMQHLANYLQPYMSVVPESLSTATTGSTHYYYYTSSPSNNYQTYGFMVYLEGDGGDSDGGYFANAF